MAENEDIKEEAAEETAAEAPAAPQQQARQSVTIDDGGVHAAYANFCRVSSSPEELILDLGLNPQPYATGEVTVRVSQRLILNHYTAKRLLHALNAALQSHEKVFGVLETDVRKRVNN